MRDWRWGGDRGYVYLFSVYDPFVSFPSGGRLHPLASFLEEVRRPPGLGIYQARQRHSVAAQERREEFLVLLRAAAHKQRAQSQPDPEQR